MLFSSEGPIFRSLRYSRIALRSIFFLLQLTIISKKSNIKVLKPIKSAAKVSCLKRNYHTNNHGRFCLKITPKRDDASNVTSQHFRIIDNCVKRTTKVYLSLDHHN